MLTKQAQATTLVEMVIGDLNGCQWNAARLEDVV
jgi:hypothetical protein